MNVDSVLIDGKDSEKTWGAFQGYGMLSELLVLPRVESLETNDWHERNGVEVSSENPNTKIEEDDITLHFVIGKERVPAFLEALKSKTVHTLEVPSLFPDTVWHLALKEAGSDDILGGIHVLRATFSRIKDPAGEGIETLAPGDDTELFTKLHELGFIELQGTRAEIEKGAKVKDYLRDQKAHLTLQSYDIEIPLYFGGKEVMKARTALVQYLLQPRERTIAYDGKTIKGVYSKSVNNALFVKPDGTYWWELTVTLKITTF